MPGETGRRLRANQRRKGKLREKGGQDYHKTTGGNSLAARIKACQCENCGGRTDEIHMHHVKSLKDLTGRNEFELLMMKKRRKSLALCPDCFAKTRG